jgi:hypothetical protein
MFSQVLLKSLPQSVLAPWSAVLIAGFPKVWANIPRLSVDPFVLESRSFAPFRFTRAVSVGNPREFLQAEKEDQEMAEACKRLIKNCIICWNYLYLSQKLEEIEDAATRQVFLDAVAHGSVISWQHINLLGEYDFSDEKLQDNVGIRPPKLTP